MLTPLEALKQARALIERGWAQGDWHDTIERDDGAEIECFCAVGAVMQTTLGDAEALDETEIPRPFWPQGLIESMFDLTGSDGVFVAAMQALNTHLPAGFDTLMRFNDHPATDHLAVLVIFDKAIADLQGAAA